MCLNKFTTQPQYSNTSIYIFSFISKKRKILVLIVIWLLLCRADLVTKHESRVGRSGTKPNIAIINPDLKSLDVTYILFGFSKCCVSCFESPGVHFYVHINKV